MIIQGAFFYTVYTDSSGRVYCLLNSLATLRFSTILPILLLTSLLTGCNASITQNELAIINASVWTADPDQPAAEALLTRGNRIVVAFGILPNYLLQENGLSAAIETMNYKDNAMTLVWPVIPDPSITQKVCVL